ncbi:hypothetical protein OEZ86_013837 [Tetradesmus obliquus]|nr:hypothetical protein OEZ86_013837 [Tetradesmus obliquus]
MNECVVDVLDSNCQVPSCGADLSDAAGYFRRHQVCAEHCRAPVLLIDGQQQRFCQQCGIFQLLSEFEGTRKSCRAGLEAHNARRRIKGCSPDAKSDALEPRTHRRQAPAAAAAAAAAGVAGHAEQLSSGTDISSASRAFCNLTSSSSEDESSAATAGSRRVSCPRSKPALLTCKACLAAAAA